jgi:hypothetical protein
MRALVVAGLGLMGAAGAAWGSAGVVRAQGVDAAAVADRFLPAERVPVAAGESRQSCSAVLEEAAGEPAVVLAAYTSRAAGAVRVLRRVADGTWSVVFDSPTAWQMPGTSCRVRLQDLDFDGRPEVFVYVAAVRANTGWVFRWDRAALTSITPADASGDRVTSRLLDPTVYDLTHAGPLQVIAARRVENLPPGARSANPAYVYRVDAAGLRADRAILAVMGFRADVDPRSNVRAFRLMVDSTGPYRLRVVNGERGGRNRVTGATVTVNDVVVLEPRDLTAGTEFATVTLPNLETQNRVTAVVSGAPESRVLLVFEDATRR